MTQKKSKWAIWEDKHCKRVHMGLFDYTFIVAVFNDIKTIEQYVAWKFDSFPPPDDYADVALGRTYYRTGYVPIIWIPKRPKTAKEWGTLAHEACHGVQHLFDWAGMRINKDTDEIFAHAVKRIVEAV